MLQKCQITVEQFLHLLVVLLDVLHGLLHLLARHFLKEFVDLLHEFLQLFRNHLVKEFVDLFLLLYEVFVAQFVLFHEIGQFFLLVLQLIPFILNLLLLFQQVFHLLFVQPVQILFLDEVLQHLFNLILQFLSLLRLVRNPFHNVLRRLVGNAVQGRLRRLVIGKSLRTLRLGSVEAVVVPHHEIDLHVLSRHDAKVVHVELVEER